MRKLPRVRTTFLCLTSLTLLACSSSLDRRRVELLDRLEATLKLPSGAAPLNHYKRFYSDGPNGQILGEFIREGKENDKRQWVAHLPIIDDGGCGIVHVRFDPKSSRSEAWCNGVA